MSGILVPDKIDVSDEPVAGNYFVAAYPPFSAWRPAHNRIVLETLDKPAGTAPLGLYIHIPFCQKKCDYCYYLSYSGQDARVIDRYLDALLQEMNWYSRRPGVKNREVAYVYFGGGTPSLLSVRQTEKLLAGLQSIFPWKNVKEVTFECAPRSTRPDFLQSLRSHGVTRASMGVQSFDNRILKLNGRIHLAEDVLRAYEMIRRARFDWVNLDLMTGMIAESQESWQETVRQMIAISPESVTIYQTEIPYNTQLYADWREGHLPATPATWASKRQRLHYGFDQLVKAGYTIVSAYSAVKDPARHRFLYQHYLWGGYDMIGLGVASFSYFNGVHYQNEVTLDKYAQRIEKEEIPLKRAFPLSRRDQLVREFVLQLKWGEVSGPAFERKFGVALEECFADELAGLAGDGLLTYDATGVRLTPAGVLKADRLLPKFYDSEYRDVRYT